MAALAATLGAITLVSWVYWLLAADSVRRLLRTAPPAASVLPPVSILKPVRGRDPGALESFATFCAQDYPQAEVLFGVEDPGDPAVDAVDALRRRHRGVPIHLVVAPAPGPNRKASLLEALAAAAHHDILVAADADMRVEPGYLRRVVSTLMQPGVGLVTCPYHGDDARSLPARLEALHMGVTFLPSAALANGLLGLPFALGATVALRRSTLQRLGGFAAVTDFLADDYQLGHRVAALGERVVMCPEVLRSVLGSTTLREQWRRELRWCRCNRASRPAGHLGYALTFSTPLALATLCAAGFGAMGWGVLAGSLGVRWAVALAVARWTGDATSRRALPLLPLRDLLTAVVWVAGLLGDRVYWRGDLFRVDGEGRLLPLASRAAGAGSPPLAAERDPSRPLQLPAAR